MRDASELDLSGFRYYRLDRDLLELKDGEPAIAGTPPRSRSMHGDVLDAAMKLFRPGPEARAWARAMVWSWFCWLPEYFFEAPASATGKFHPAWANRPDGLLLHSLAVCRVAASLSELLDLEDQDYNALVFAAWHHDMFKYGDLEAYAPGAMTVHEHPVLAGGFFRLPEVRRLMAGFGVPEDACDVIARLVSAHAGPYRTSRHSDIKLPECKGALEKLLYKADYFASRKEDAWVSGLLAQMP